MIQHSSNEVALTREATPSIATNGKRIAKVAGAAALSFGLVGTFALPAYATVGDDLGPLNTQESAQVLSTNNVETAVTALQIVEGDVDTKVLADERAEEERLQAAETAAEDAASDGNAQLSSGADVPSGAGAQGIANAAGAQLGQSQDCTALVERSLRAVGIPAGDLGTRASEYVALGGTQVGAGSYAVGDVLVYEGNHVAVYVGNGQAVHGGWTGYTTAKVGTGTMHGQPTSVVRF